MNKNILNKIDIVEVIKHYIKLEQRNKNYWAKCPFHNDNSPSLSVSKEKRIFKCFACNKSGNAINFVMDFLNINYFLALKEISKITGIEFYIEEKQVYNSFDKKIINANNFVSKIYKNNIFKHENIEILNYLELRKISKELIDKFQIGYAENKNNQISEVLKIQSYISHNEDKDSEVSSEDLINANLVYIDKNNEKIDYFKDRIMFPVLDKYSNVLGFSARSLNNEVASKYLLSKTNSVFQKHEIFYNIQNIIPSINFVYIVEGIFDLISLESINIPNVLCSMGISISKKHLESLNSNDIKNIILCFDNDQAGSEAIIKNGIFLKENGFNVYTIENNTQYKDFNELLINDIESLKNIINNKIDLVLFYLKNKINSINNTMEKVNVFEDCIEFIKKYGLSILVSKYIEELIKLDPNYNFENLKNYFNKKQLSINTYKAYEIKKKNYKLQLEKILKQLIITCSKSKEWFEAFFNSEYCIPNYLLEYKQAFEILNEFYSNNNISFFEYYFNDDIKQDKFKDNIFFNDIFKNSIKYFQKIEFNKKDYDEIISKIKMLEKIIFKKN